MINFSFSCCYLGPKVSGLGERIKGFLKFGYWFHFGYHLVALLLRGSK